MLMLIDTFKMPMYQEY